MKQMGTFYVLILLMIITPSYILKLFLLQIGNTYKPNLLQYTKSK